jgi:hypothetical protein
MQIKVFFARFLNTPEKVLSPSTWEEKKWNDFLANQKVIKKVPACQK